MPILRNVLGLDVGSHAIKAVEVQQNLRGFEAVQIHSLPTADDELGLSDLLQRFVALHNLPTEHIVSALPGDQISARRLSFPFREKKKIAAAVPFEIEGEIIFDIDDVIVDWEVVSDERNRADVVALCAPRKVVSEFLGQLRDGRCEPRTLEGEGLVLGNLASVFELMGTRLLVDIGHRKATCCLTVDGRAVAARTIPVAGQALTQALAMDLGVERAEAERIKCEEGIVAVELGVKAPKAGAVLDRLAREIARTLGSFEPVLAGGAVSELTLFGGTAGLNRIDQYLTERIGIPAERLGLPDEVHCSGFAAGGPPTAFAPAIALALRGTAQARTRVNFRQDEFAVRVDFGRYGRQFRLTAAIAGAALLLAVINFATTVGLESGQRGQLESEIAALYGEAFPGKPVPRNALGALREAVRSANERAEFLGVYRGNMSALDLLTEISKHVPPDLEITFEEVAIDRQSIRLRVYAESFEAADRLGAELAKFPSFGNARIGAIETDRKTGAKRFNVTISLAE